MQTGDSMHPQLRIYHRLRPLAYAAGADRVEDGGTDLRRDALQILFATVSRAGLVLLRTEGGQRRRGGDMTGQAYGTGSGL